MSVSWPPRVVGVARSAMFRAVTDGWKRYWWGTGTEQTITTSSINYQIIYYGVRRKMYVDVFFAFIIRAIFLCIYLWEKRTANV